jgi:hypothetical protein
MPESPTPAAGGSDPKPGPATTPQGSDTKRKTSQKRGRRDSKRGRGELGSYALAAAAASFFQLNSAILSQLWSFLSAQLLRCPSLGVICAAILPS